MYMSTYMYRRLQSSASAGGANKQCKQQHITHHFSLDPLAIPYIVILRSYIIYYNIIN